MKKTEHLTCSDQLGIDKRVDPKRFEEFKSVMFEIINVINPRYCFNSSESFGKYRGGDICIFPVCDGNKEIGLLDRKSVV